MSPFSHLNPLYPLSLTYTSLPPSLPSSISLSCTVSQVSTFQISYLFSSLKSCQRIRPGQWLHKAFRKKLEVLRLGVVSAQPNNKAGVHPPVGCPVTAYSIYFQQHSKFASRFLHLRAEEEKCRGDKIPTECGSKTKLH